MEGVKLQAHNIALDAADNIHLLAAKNTTDLQSKNSGSSAGIGATLGANGQQTGLSFQLGASLSKGYVNGSETTVDNTRITATNHPTINSGGDTAINDAFTNPLKVQYVPRPYGPTFKCVSKNATVVANLEGNVVTTWGTSAAGTAK